MAEQLPIIGMLALGLFFELAGVCARGLSVWLVDLHKSVGVLVLI